MLAAALCALTGVGVHVYDNRLSVAVAARTQCERQALANVAAVNNLRGDVYDLQGDIKALGAQRGATDRKRRSVAVKLASISTLDGQIDRGDWSLLSDRRDRARVRFGRGQFRCNAEFPKPGWLPLVD